MNIQLKKRLFSSCVLIALLALWLVFHCAFYEIFLALMAFILGGECLRMVYPRWSFPALLGGAALLIAGWLLTLLCVPLGNLADVPASLQRGLCVLVVIFFFACVLMRSWHQKGCPRPRLWVLYVMLWGIGFSFGGCVLWFQAVVSAPEGILKHVLPLWFTVMITDVGAYIAGKTWGQHHLPLWWSPTKTWEGVCGGLVGAILLAIVWPWGSIGLACMVSMAAQMGDALESMLKRYYGVKDSGSWIPGHGGLFDRFDGFWGVYTALAWGYVIGSLMA